MRFRLLKALLASTNRVASQSSMKNYPDYMNSGLYPCKLTCTQLLSASSLLNVTLQDGKNSLRMILRTTSHTPIGHMPRYLSKAISRQARNGERILGDKYSQHKRRANKAMASHKLSDAEQNEVQRWCQPLASTPKGPAAPKVRRAAAGTRGPCNPSKITG